MTESLVLNIDDDELNADWIKSRDADESVVKHAVHDQKTHGRRSIRGFPDPTASSMRGYEETGRQARSMRGYPDPAARRMRGYETSEAASRMATPRIPINESASEQASREQGESIDYIMGRMPRPPDWTGPSDDLFVPKRSLSSRIRSARRKVKAWRDRRAMERITPEELEQIGAANRERFNRRRAERGLPPRVYKSFDPVYEILQRIFADVVEPSIWFALVEDPRSLYDLTGPLGDLVDDMLNAVAPQGTVIKFAPGLRPVLKHQSGKHEQKKHGRRGSKSDIQKAADMWIGSTKKFSYPIFDEMRATARVLTDDTDDYYPKDDSDGDPTEVFDSTKSLLLEIASASPSEETLYRGLALQPYDQEPFMELLREGTEFDELVASWTPDKKIANDFAAGKRGGSETYGVSDPIGITLRVEKLPSVEMMEHYSGDKSGIIGKADERVASGKYRVEKVSVVGDGQYLIDVSFQGLPFDSEFVRNTEYTGGRSTFQPRRSAIVRKSAESDLAARMSLDIDMAVVKHQAGKHEQKTHGVWAAGAGSSDAASRARESALTGGPTGLTAEDLQDVANNPSSYGLVMTENDKTIQRDFGFMPDEEMAVRGKLQVIEDGFLIRDVRQEKAQEALDSMTPNQIKNTTALHEMARTEGKVMVAAPLEAAEKILESERFQTLLETKTSGGSTDFDARLREEFASHDLHPNTTGDKRPVYGYVAFDKPNVESVWNYGEVRFELKPEVKSRTTMTDGDSLGSRATPVPMTGPSLTPIQVAGASLGWNSMSDRASEDYDFKDSRGIFDRYSDESYFETQIKGGVTISDVSKIHIPIDDGDFYRNLVDAAAERGVEVVKYDA